MGEGSSVSVGVLVGVGLGVFVNVAVGDGVGVLVGWNEGVGLDGSGAEFGVEQAAKRMINKE